MLQWIANGVGALAGLAWLSAAVHALMLLPHRSDEVSLGTLLMSGFRFYQRETWKPSGHVYYRRFIGSVLAFVLLLAVTMIFTVLRAA
jgi:hypothetical protein